MATPDKGIPQDMLANAHCIVIVPGLKTAAFLVGGKYGKGYVSCRSKSGVGWSAPGTVRIEGGSVGFQIGGSQTDLIMLVMSERGADKLLSSKFTLGAEGSVAAGPVGRTATAQTDAQMHGEILSWSRSQGVFAGLALEGATLRQDLHTLRQKTREPADRNHAGAYAQGERETDYAAQQVLGTRAHEHVNWLRPIRRERKIRRHKSIHRHTPDRMRSSMGAGTTKTKREFNRMAAGAAPIYRVTVTERDREGDQLPASQRSYQDRLQRYRAHAECPR